MLASFAGAPASAQTSGSFGKNKIAYRKFDWHIYHSPHFNLYYYTAEEPLLEKVASLAESAYDRLSRDFNFQIKEPVPLIFYATHSAFEQNNVIQNFIPEGIGAFASPARFRMVMPVDLADSELMELILHELTHIFQYKILFQGRLAEAATTSPPTWFMEGMASYMAKDESSRDKMFLRDAVVNDQIPSVGDDFGGFFAYRFGHAVFDFIEDRWGKDGFLDFVYEARNALGSRVDRAVKRTFKLEVEDFDAEFRRWLRKKYLAQLIVTGEPGDFGRLFRVEGSGGRATYETSPTASPSGDLVAAFSSYKGDVDVVLFDARKRKLLRNLTKGYSSQYQYPVAQELELGRKTGRDLAFSPDGNTIALFVKRESGRSLAMLDVLKGGIRKIIDMKDIEQQLAPAWSPDGKTVAFSGFQNGQFDIFTIDLDTLAITNLTGDPVFDGAPTYSPDGKSIIFVSDVGDKQKLFRIDLSNPKERFAVTTGDSIENDPIYSPDGKRVYFTSDRAGAENIYSLDLTTGTLLQHTNVVTGASMPTILKGEAGKENLVYTGFWKGTFDLYLSELEEKIGAPASEAIAAAPTNAQAIPRFEPDIQVAIDDANKEKYGGRKFFLEGAQTYVGVDDNQTVIGQVQLSFSDYLGDKRIQALFSSIESLSNFDFIYADVSHRWQWNVNLFDTRLFYASNEVVNGDFRRGSSALEETGLTGSVAYPFSFYRRAELGLGYIQRKIKFNSFIQDPRTGLPVQVIAQADDNYPILQAAWVSDTTAFIQSGPHSGHRIRLDGAYAPDTGGSGTLLSQVDLDARKYIAFTQRSGLALRAYAAATDGNSPTPLRIGGLDTVRGVDFLSLLGDRAFFTNIELRFPLIDVISTPFLGFQGVRGVLFFDTGGAWFKDVQNFRFYDSKSGKLQDGVAAYGWGVSARLLGGLDFNWDFAKPYKSATQRDSGFRTSFWIGTRF